MHWEWQLGDDQPYRHRRAEDIAACNVLSAAPLHLGLLDAIYRHDDDGQPLYARDAKPESDARNFIGGDVHPHDWQLFAPLVKDALRILIKQAQRIYCPLGIGGHVDHVLVRHAVEALTEIGQVMYYEDFPYADKVDWQDSDVTAGLVPTETNLSEVDIAARIGAIACYSSQQFALFEHAENMPARVRNYIAAANGERYWTRTDAVRNSY